jgi:hypothetical protein
VKICADPLHDMCGTEVKRSRNRAKLVGLFNE